MSKNTTTQFSKQEVIDEIERLCTIIGVLYAPYRTAEENIKLIEALRYAVSLIKSKDKDAENE